MPESTGSLITLCLVAVAVCSFNLTVAVCLSELAVQFFFFKD